MTVSKFLNKAPVKITPPKQLTLRKSNFAGGQDTLTSIEELGPNVSPYLRNVRNVHQGSIGTKKGPGFYGVAPGQTTGVTQTSTTGGTDVALTTTSWAASSFTAGSTARMPRADFRVKQGGTAGTAPIIVELWSDSSGPAAKLASSSISVASVTSSYQLIQVNFIEAPALVSGTKYWWVLYQQSNGTGGYLWSASSTYASSGLTSVNSGTTWSSGNGFNFTNYLATNGGTLGGGRFNVGGTNYDVIAIKEVAGTTGVYWINPSTGALTSISTGLSSSATYYSFAYSTGILVYCNGFDSPRQWNGSTDVAIAVVDSGNNNLLSAPAMLVVSHKNRWFFLENGTSRVVFSEVGTATTYLSTNFIYVPSPNNGDAPNSMFELQDYLWFGARKAKWVLSGSDSSSFVLRRSTASKGTVTQPAVVVDGNFAYFASDDGFYSCNGTTDTIISRAITPDYQALADLTKIVMVVWNNQLRCYVPYAGSPVNNGLMMLDLVNGGWFLDNNAYVSVAFRYQQKGDPLLLIECSSLVGQAFKAEQQYSDLGKPIKLEYYDAPQAMGDPGLFKQVLFYYVRFVTEAGSYTIDCQMDKELQNSPASYPVNLQGGGAKWGTAVWGSFVWGQSNFDEFTVPVSGEYRWFQPRFVITGADTPVELQGYSLVYLLEQPR